MVCFLLNLFLHWGPQWLLLRLQRGVTLERWRCFLGQPLKASAASSGSKEAAWLGTVWLRHPEPPRACQSPEQAERGGEKGYCRETDMGRVSCLLVERRGADREKSTEISVLEVGTMQRGREGGREGGREALGERQHVYDGEEMAPDRQQDKSKCSHTPL